MTYDDAGTGTIFLPASWDRPLLIDMGLDQAAIVTPGGLATLANEWDGPGIYVLLWESGQTGSPAYVGKAPTRLKTRVRQHIKGKPGWVRAILVRRLIPLNTAQVGWLEGALVTRLREAPRIAAENTATPSEEYLRPHEVRDLTLLIDPVLGLLRLTGANPDPAGPDVSGLTPFPNDEWLILHRLLAVLPSARWTTYGDLGTAVNIHPRGLGSHLRACAHCTNAHRVLNSTGVIADGFAWTDPDDQRDPKNMLKREGVRFTGLHADNTQRLTVKDLRALLIGGAVPGKQPKAKVPAPIKVASKPTPKSEKSSSLLTYVANGSLPVATTLAGQYKGVNYTCEVKQDGSVSMPAGTRFNSPSAAAKSITGREMNGWVFWRLPDGELIDTLRPNEPRDVDV